MVSYQSTRKLNSYLVRAKLYSIERKVGSCKCNGKRCEVCKNALETYTFTSCSNDQTTYKINHKFDCNEKCLVYSRYYISLQMDVAQGLIHITSRRIYSKLLMTLIFKLMMPIERNILLKNHVSCNLC